MPDQERPRVDTRKSSWINPIHIRIRSGDMPLARREQEASPAAEEDTAQEVGQLQGVYIISVAARLLDMHPQTLRKYERLGLVQPSRTFGMLRLYSEEDIQKLHLIKHLEENLGLNLAGVDFTLNLLSNMFEMLERLSEMHEAEQYFGLIEEEMTNLLRRLNLPLQE